MEWRLVAVLHVASVVLRDQLSLVYYEPRSATGVRQHEISERSLNYLNMKYCLNLNMKYCLGRVPREIKRTFFHKDVMVIGLRDGGVKEKFVLNVEILNYLNMKYCLEFAPEKLR